MILRVWYLVTPYIVIQTMLSSNKRSSIKHIVRKKNPIIYEIYLILWLSSGIVIQWEWFPHHCHIKENCLIKLNEFTNTIFICLIIFFDWCDFFGWFGGRGVYSPEWKRNHWIRYQKNEKIDICTYINIYELLFLLNQYQFFNKMSLLFIHKIIGSTPTDQPSLNVLYRYTIFLWNFYFNEWKFSWA